MNKKKPNYFKNIMIILFVLFMVAYVVGESGYYESTLNNEVMLTNEQIKQFEEDVLNGENVDLNTYIVESNTDYSNAVTNIGETINNGVVAFMSDGISGMVGVLRTLFY